MKLISVAAMALMVAAPVFATPAVSVDFEMTMDLVPVDSLYAAKGVTFTNVLGLVNSAAFTYYSNAPSMQGVGYVYLDGMSNTTAFMNVAAGVDHGLTFFYSSAMDLSGAVKAYSGLDGTGTLLRSIDLAANDFGAYDQWNSAWLYYDGTAQSFDLSGMANVALLDNISDVPEPASSGLVMAGLLAAGLMTRRRKS